MQAQAFRLMKARNVKREIGRSAKWAEIIKSKKNDFKKWNFQLSVLYLICFTDFFRRRQNTDGFILTLFKDYTQLLLSDRIRSTAVFTGRVTLLRTCIFPCVKSDIDPFTEITVQVYHLSYYYLLDLFRMPYLCCAKELIDFSNFVCCVGHNIRSTSHYNLMLYDISTFTQPQIPL